MEVEANTSSSEGRGSFKTLNTVVTTSLLLQKAIKRWKDILNTIEKRPDGCWISLVKKEGKMVPRNDGKGYAQIVLDGPSGNDNKKRAKLTETQRKEVVPTKKQISIYIHQLAWLAGEEFNDVNVKKICALVLAGEIWHISHLCHNHQCCNPDHLSAEPEWVNIYRKVCRAKLYNEPCDCHHDRLGQVRVFKSCLQKS